MSKPLADPFSIRSKGGSGEADATIKLPGVNVSAIDCADPLLAGCFAGDAAARAPSRADGVALFRRLAQRTRMNPVVELGPLPLRAEQALLDRAYLRRAYFVAGCAQVS